MSFSVNQELSSLLNRLKQKWVGSSTITRLSPLSASTTKMANHIHISSLIVLYCRWYLITSAFLWSASPEHSSIWRSRRCPERLWEQNCPSNESGQHKRRSVHDRHQKMPRGKRRFFSISFCCTKQMHQLTRWGYLENLIDLTCWPVSLHISPNNHSYHLTGDLAMLKYYG